MYTYNQPIPVQQTWSYNTAIIRILIKISRTLQPWIWGILYTYFDCLAFFVYFSSVWMESTYMNYENKTLTTSIKHMCFYQILNRFIKFSPAPISLRVVIYAEMYLLGWQNVSSSRGIFTVNMHYRKTQLSQKNQSIIFAKRNRKNADSDEFKFCCLC